MTDHSQRPLFSIATPCFNSAKTIERTFKSILAQEFKDYEYIVVDGGSTDGTIDIIKQYEPLFEGRMHWISEPDKGLYDAFNKGVLRSNGIYCWNVNSDDYIEADALQTIHDYIEKLPSGDYPCIVGRMRFVEANSLSTLNVSECITPQNIERAYRKDFMGISHPATLVPRTTYSYVGLYDIRFRISADIDWFNRAYTAGIIFTGMNDVLINMTDGGVSCSSRNLSIATADRILAFKKKYSSSEIAYLHLFYWKLRRLKNKIL